jgi:hypothetical protein
LEKWNKKDIWRINIDVAFEEKNPFPKEREGVGGYMVFPDHPTYHVVSYLLNAFIMHKDEYLCANLAVRYLKDFKYSEIFARETLFPVADHLTGFYYQPID